jgi:hypothetical protein
MNFFGHAVVGLWHSDDRRFLLGAMLPDLCGMLGIRVARADEPRICAGIDFHHRTDAAFHGAERFVQLCSESVETLTAQGVGRGTSRAVGHVGTELLLDGVLSRQGDASTAYREALALAVDERLAQHVLVSEEDQARLHRGLTRLVRAPMPEAYLDTTFVIDRLQAVLASRPRLAMQHSDVVHVHKQLQHLSEAVTTDWATLLDQVRRRLESVRS